MISSISLAQDLVRFETINPPGNETPCARHIGRILEGAGFKTAYYDMGGGRENLIARVGDTGAGAPLCFTGHTDVVPLGAAPWSVPPFGGEIAAGRLYGRGSTDMKGGVAAFVAAAARLAPKLARTKGVVLVITAGEERGCEGANFLARKRLLPSAGAMVVAEPTANRPLAGHKGVMWFEGIALGVTAHGSMPEQGVNAVYKAARAALAFEALDLGDLAHPVLGRPTLNVGWLRGGLNINSVPDEARFGLDVRIVPGLDKERLLSRLQDAAGDVQLAALGNSDPVWTDPADPWLAGVASAVEAITGKREPPAGAPYFTDAAALKPAMGQPPTVVLGPGEPTLAHQTDEFCLVRNIEDADAIYTELIVRWCGV